MKKEVSQAEKGPLLYHALDRKLINSISVHVDACRAKDLVLLNAFNGSNILHLHASYQMARRLRFENVSKNDTRSILTYYHQAAIGGHAGACYDLALLHLEGHPRMSLIINRKLALFYATACEKVFLKSNEFNEIEYYDQSHFIELCQALSKKLSSH